MPVSEAAFEALKQRVSELETDQAVKVVTDQGLDKRLGKIESVLSRLTWLIITVVVLAMMGFVISGGLSHVPIPSVG